MKLTSILVMALAAGAAWAQTPDVIENTRSTLKAVEQKKAKDSNAALAASPRQATKLAAPSPDKTAPAAKPAPGKGGMNSSAPAQSAATGMETNASNAKVKPAPHMTTAPKAAVKPAKARKPARPKQKVDVEATKNPQDRKEAPKTINLSRRDPFVSPVVNRSILGSGCSTGKRCLTIEQINLKGVVKAETGMIAVVVNAMNKAYFLRENDPVFNGYVIKITGDSIVFKETVQDRMGKPFTREVVKKITTPAV